MSSICRLVTVLAATLVCACSAPNSGPDAMTSDGVMGADGYNRPDTGGATPDADAMGGADTHTVNAPDAGDANVSNVPDAADVVVTVGTCSDLAPVGQWEDITPSSVTLTAPFTGPLMVLPDPIHSGTVYMTTSVDGVLKSTDCGSTWTKTNTGTNGSQLDMGSIWSAVLDPNAPDTLYALTGYGPPGVWKSTDGGVDWNQLFPAMTDMPGFVGRISMDPTNSAHLVLSFHASCTGNHPPICFGETTDGGATWNIKDFPAALNSTAGEADGVLMLNATTWVYSNYALYYTTDAGMDWATANAAGSYVAPSIFKTPDGNYWVASGNGVMSSLDGIDWTLYPNSGYMLDDIVGDGVQLFAILGFHPPNDATFVWSAPYDQPMQWSPVSTPTVPAQLNAGANDAEYDSGHHLLYTAMQSEGLWRVVTR